MTIPRVQLQLSIYDIHIYIRYISSGFFCSAKLDKQTKPRHGARYINRLPLQNHRKYTLMQCCVAPGWESNNPPPPPPTVCCLAKSSCGRKRCEAFGEGEGGLPYPILVVIKLPLCMRQTTRSKATHATHAPQIPLGPVLYVTPIGVGFQYQMRIVCINKSLGEVVVVVAGFGFA